MAHYKKRELSGFKRGVGFLALFLIAAFFGMQSPQIPFKIWLFLIGIVLVLIGHFKLR